EAFRADGWKEVSGPVATSHPDGEGWKWITLRKDVKKGADPAELTNQRWGMITVFVFKWSFTWLESGSLHANCLDLSIAMSVDYDPPRASSRSLTSANRV